jgi:hypothetical protein
MVDVLVRGFAEPLIVDFLEDFFHVFDFLEVNFFIVLNQNVALLDCLGEKVLELFEESFDKLGVTLGLFEGAVLVTFDEFLDQNFELQILKQKSLVEFFVFGVQNCV